MVDFGFIINGNPDASAKVVRLYFTLNLFRFSALNGAESLNA